MQMLERRPGRRRNVVIQVDVGDAADAEAFERRRQFRDGNVVVGHLDFRGFDEQRVARDGGGCRTQGDR